MRCPAVVKSGERVSPHQRTYMRLGNKGFGVSGGYVDLATIPETEGNMPATIDLRTGEPTMRKKKRGQKAPTMSDEDRRAAAKRGRRARARARKK